MPPIAILSPHFDDAVLSCWRLLTSPQDVTVVNVFAGVPPPGGPAGWWDGRLGPPEAAIETRMGEDRRALALAGRSAHNLHFLDEQYRNGDQPADVLLGALAAAIPTGAIVYAPASLGHIPDHDAVRAAAVGLHANGAQVVLYADLPHAAVRGWPPWVTAAGGDERVAEAWDRTLLRAGLDPGSLEPAVTRLAADVRERKIEAVRKYGSQLPALEAIFHRRIDDPELLAFEVEWRLPPPG
jgi:LmbE family N-acetylglucosaminyl deacetylase